MSISITIADFHDSSTFSDITIQLPDRELHLHRIVLSSQSDYFQAALTTFKETSMDLTSCPFSQEILLILFESFYKDLPSKTLHKYVEDGHSISSLLDCTQYFHFTRLRTRILEVVEKNFEKQSTKFVLKLIKSMFRHMDDMPGWLQKYLQKNMQPHFQPDTDVEPELPPEIILVVMKEGIQFDVGAGMPDQYRFEVIFKAYQFLGPEQQDEVRKLLPKYLRLECVRIESIVKVVTELDDMQKLIVEPEKSTNQFNAGITSNACVLTVSSEKDLAFSLHPLIRSSIHG
ncbi:hypothetical protein HDU97_004676 [Phlyctochytrium planicorne]|nr:hypothetical protein HDU97_004676 [Phlyctochytrium planicorne]